MIRVGKSRISNRGVFAQRPIGPGEIIERAAVIVIPDAEWEHAEKTVLSGYSFMWGDDAVAIALGHGSLYNHSYHPNATFELDLDEQVIDFIALRAIEEGEEITINYNGVPDDHRPIWFDGPYWGWYPESKDLS